jgi:hypothetical protein
VWPARTVVKASQSFQLITLEPLVRGGPGDAQSGSSLWDGVALAVNTPHQKLASTEVETSVRMRNERAPFD